MERGMETELIQYIRLFRKWAWLIIIAALLGGGVGYLVTSRRPPVYQTNSMVSIGGFISSPNPTTTDIRIGEDLAQTYVALAETQDFLETTIAANGFSISTDELNDALNVRVRSNTSLLVVEITHTDPILAADLADAVAEQLILQSPTNLTAEQQSQIDLANAEIDRLSAQLEDTRTDLDEVSTILDLALESPTVTNEEINRLMTQRNILLEQINMASATIAQFNDTIADLQQRTNTLSIIEHARIPSNPSGASPLSTGLLAAMVGAALAFGIALLVEYLDDSIRTPQEATQILTLPVLGAIAKFGRARDSYKKRLITVTEPSASVSEGYRVLRTNLLYSASEKVKTYVITSPGPEEGKTVTTANLAVTLAAAGMRVLLIDADLRRPRIHEVFGLKNEVGLSTLLYANPAEGSGQNGFTKNLAACLQETEVPRLRVITSGFTPANPTEILGSALMKRWAGIFQTASNVDVVLFDTPPCLVVADSSALAASLKAPVMLVLEAGKTRRNAALKARDQFRSLNIDIQGVVLNNVRRGRGGEDYYYGGYYYYGDSKPR